MRIIHIPKLEVLLAMEIPIIPRFSYLFVAQKNFLPVEMDFAKEIYCSPFFFQIFLRIRFFDIEVRFFGTAIQKKELLIFIVVCERHVLLKIDRSF